MRALATYILKKKGWTIKGDFREEHKKCILVIAPHTSNWDFIMGRLAFWHLGLNIKFLIKKESFIWPIGGLLKKMGGVPVDRGRSANITEQVVDLFAQNDQLIIGITPEGTRSLNPRWKRGFYHIAKKAEVPMLLAYLDYKNKVGGVGPTLYPGDSMKEDLEKIYDFYRDKNARYPKQFNLSAENQK